VTRARRASTTRSASEAPRLVGVIHLPPLPGSPRASGEASRSIDDVAEATRRDAVALARAGFDAVMVENFGDAPFFPERVDPITVAAMTRCVLAAREAAANGRELLVGVNVLRNDAASAIAIAAATGASMVRINVHVGAVIADQGLIEGRAHETLRTRKAWGAERVALWVDVDVKHAAPIAPRPIVDVAKDAVLRGGAEALLVTGKATGAPADARDVARLHQALPRTPIFVASGSSPSDLPTLAEAGAHGVIVGSWLRRDGRAGGPIDARRATSFAKAFRRAFTPE
jgi:membrane complex biogenesis BtpA family protein